MEDIPSFFDNNPKSLTYRTHALLKGPPLPMCQLIKHHFPRYISLAQISKHFPSNACGGGINLWVLNIQDYLE